VTKLANLAFYSSKKISLFFSLFEYLLYPSNIVHYANLANFYENDGSKSRLAFNQCHQK